MCYNSRNSSHVFYTVKLPVFNNDKIQLSGVCQDRITERFQDYPIKGKVEEDIHHAFLQDGGKPDELPKLLDRVGGNINYLRYHPVKVYQLSSGLNIYIDAFSEMLMEVEV